MELTLEPRPQFQSAVPMSKPLRRISRNAAPKLKGDALAMAMQERVRRYHMLGKLGMRAAELMKKYGLSQSAAFKANQFYDRYTTREMVAFLELPRRRSGLPLHWGHIQYLLVVPTEKKAIREELQKKAVEQDWNPKELLAEIRRRIPGERGPGGRPRKNGPGSKAFIPSLSAQVNDVADRMKQLDEKLRSGEQRPSRRLKLQLADLDRAAIALGKIIQRARRAGGG